MKLRARVREWWRSRRQRTASALDLLREFVYLDDVSVYSLLASKRGAITTEFTETETLSLNSEITGSLGGNFGVAKGDTRSRVDSGRTQGSQVLRKAIIQATFKELYDLERDSLTLRPASVDGAPTVQSASDLRGELDRVEAGPWVVDQDRLRRGHLIEAEVALEAESIFRVSAVITTILDIMQENQKFFGAEDLTGIAEVRSVGRMLESLLAGLVPIRGCLVDYEAMDLSGREVLVHRAVLDGLADGERPQTRPVTVVGLAERDLFWKDIRRLLFTGATYRVFARISSSGLISEWQPLKLVEVLKEVHPLLAKQIGEIGDLALVAMGDAAAGSGTVGGRIRDQERSAMAQYAALLSDHHGKQLEPRTLAAIIANIEPAQDWLATVVGRRRVFSEITRRIDELMGVETGREAAARYRVAAMNDIGLGLGGAFAPNRGLECTDHAPSREERIIETEIVAIYW